MSEPGQRKNEEKQEEVCRGRKRPLEIHPDQSDGANKSEPEVHSANDWEHADLGGEDRRQKFLRLMGAAKKEHHGRFVIGDSNVGHGRTEDETRKISSQLEQQFSQGMEKKVSGAARHHKGLGFEKEVESSTDAEKGAKGSSEAEGKSEANEKSDSLRNESRVEEGEEQQKDESSSVVPDSTSGNDSTREMPQGYKKMTFVKSNS